MIVCAADIAPESVIYLWKGRIALGKVTNMEGPPDVGKSTIQADLAARTSSGRPMPDGTPSPLGPAGVLILAAAEDGLADTWIPRLTAAGADLDRVKIWRGTPTDTEGYLRGFELTAQDLAAVEAIIREHDIRLVCVDALMATLPAGNRGNSGSSHFSVVGGF